MDDDDRLFATRPDSVKRLRACITCKLVKTYEQFYEEYCENCAHKRPDIDNPGRRDEFVQSETTDDFVGTVAMLVPTASWVAKWLGMTQRDSDGNTTTVKPGVYAVSLPGLEQAEAGMDARDDEDEDEEDEEEEEETSRAPAVATNRPAPARRSNDDDPEAREAALAEATLEPDDDDD